MKKAEQKVINAEVEEVYKSITVDGHFYDCYGHPTKRLYYCSAGMIKGENGIYLRSYNTIVAFIPYGKNVCYDFLRLVYGFTATSAQHISKFAKYNGVSVVKSWKEV